MARVARVASSRRHPPPNRVAVARGGALGGRSRSVQPATRALSRLGVRSVNRPTVVCIVDKPGWAHERKTDALAQALAPTYRITKRYEVDVTPDDIDGADCVLVYYWLQIERRPHLRAAFVRARERLAVGICSEFELDGPLRVPGLAVLEELAAVVFVNSRRLLDLYVPRLTRPVFYTPNGVDTAFFRQTDRRH